MLQRIDFTVLARGLLAGDFTTKSLGKAVGLTQPSVSRLATGKTKSVSAEVGVKLIRLAGGTVVVPEALQNDQQSLVKAPVVE